MMLKSFIIGPGIDTREAALEEFWKYHEAHNAHHRKKPKDFIKVVRVTAKEHGWWVYYTVPARKKK